MILTVVEGHLLGRSKRYRDCFSFLFGLIQYFEFVAGFIRNDEFMFLTVEVLSREVVHHVSLKREWGFVSPSMSSGTSPTHPSVSPPR